MERDLRSTPLKGALPTSSHRDPALIQLAPPTPLPSGHATPTPHRQGYSRQARPAHEPPSARLLRAKGEILGTVKAPDAEAAKAAAAVQFDPDELNRIMVQELA